MEFVNKEYFLLLLLLIPYIWYLIRKKNTEPTMRMSDIAAYRSVPRSRRVRLIGLPNVLRIVTFVFLVLVLARPQTNEHWGTSTTEGIDIMMAIDVSTSMLAQDLKPNRIESAKDVAAEFISDRPDDNIGLVVFAGEAFTQCPMTTDHASLMNMLKNVRTDLAQRGLIQDGTAVGMGLANAISKLKDSKAKSKVVILLTDGSNNSGDISPLTAAQIAKSLGIRVYTIAVGSNKLAPYPVEVGGTVRYVNMRSDVDPKTLSEIAQTTDGHFYRATNSRELKQVYKDIDKLEKTKMSVQKFSRHYDVFQPFALVVFMSLLLEVILRLTVFRRLP